MREKSIELLNKAVADELTAIHQYMYFHFHCDNQGYDLLAALFRKTAIEEMMHVERLAERILFLKGDVVMKPSGAVQALQDVSEMLAASTAMEQQNILDYNRWAMECAANADSVSKTLLESIVVDEERHFDQYDTEGENLKRFGERYLALQSMERSKARSGGMPMNAGGRTGGEPGA
jgi:bacterioferritin